MTNNEKIKILILDDDFTIREILKSLLKRTLKNVLITTSDNGVKGLGLIELVNPDLIVVDSTLPEFAGTELVHSLKSKSGFSNARKIALLHEDENFPKVNDPSLMMFNKDDANFVEKFVTYLSYTFSIESKPTHRHSVQNSLATIALGTSNKSDVIMHKISKTNSILNPLRWIIWLSYQVFLSFILTFFYLYSGGKIKEVDESGNKYLTAYRVRYYPTLTTLIVGLLILLFQVGIFIISGFAVLNSNLNFLVAQTACPLPGAPTVINNQVVISPDNIDGIIDCAGLDIIVGPTGEIVMDRHVIQNNYTNGDWGVTLLVNNLTVQEGGKITADGKGYTVLESESVGRGGDSAGQSGGAGGGHGGAGGQGVEDSSNPSGFGGIAYGNNEAPTTLGSAGGNGGGVTESFQYDWLTNERFNTSGTSFSSGLQTGSTTGLELKSEEKADVVTDGLISYFKLDEQSGQDLSNSVDGAGSGTLGADSSVSNDDPTILTEEDCKNKSCISFDGIDDYANLGSVDLNDESFTISSWFKTQPVAQDQSVITLTNTSLPGVSVDVVASDDLTNANKLRFLYRAPSGTENGDSIYSTTIVTDNQWHHFAAQFNSTGEIKLYIDGEQEAVMSTTGTLGVMDLIAGRAGPSEAFNYFSGSIDDIRVYNSALTSENIQSIFEFTPGLVFASGEQTWLSETVGDGNSQSILISSITVDWVLDGGNNITPKFQILGSQTGTFSGEESVYPSSGSYYQNGGTYNINDNSQRNTTEINGYFKYWKIRAILNSGSNLEDTPRINGITLVGTSQESGNAVGGAGGGAIKIVATGDLVVNGRISANGLDGQAQGTISGGGGSGGSIWIEANSFSGNGIVEAKGGIGAEVQYQGGGGGGGRLVMLCNTSNGFTGNANVNPGVTSNSQDGGIGTIIGPTCRPNSPSVLKQFKSNQSTEIPIGGTTTETSVYFVSELSDVDAGETLLLQLEIRPLNENFTNVPTHIQGSPLSNPQICTVGTTNCGKILVSNLERSKEFHWQVRVRDSKGGYSNWVSFGSNDESARDLLVTGNPHTLEYVGGNNQSNTVNTNVNDSLAVRVLDINGFAIPGYTVGWSIPNSSVGGQFVGGSAITDDNGYSTRQYKLGTRTGVNTVRASVSGLPSIDFSLTGTPDVLGRFSITAPPYGIISSDFGPVTITAFDVYENIKTDYQGTVTLTAVEPNTTNTVAGTLSPDSYTFVDSDDGIKVISNFNFDTQSSIRIMVTDNEINAISNIIAIVTSLGSCPDVDGLIDSNQTWSADANNLGIFDCTNVAEVRVLSGFNLNLESYIVADSNYTNDYSVTILANDFVVEATASVTSNGKGYGTNSGPGTSGSYGGYGTSGMPYGNLREPYALGSGGSTGGASPGGAGGGGIKLDIVDTLTLEGSITANGNNGAANVCNQVGSGGSGGSIFIKAANLTKSTTSSSVISTNGGNGGSNCITAGSGSGGRIAIYVTDSDTLTDNANLSIQSRGGSGSGGAGTYYYEGPNQVSGIGILTVDNNNTSTKRASISGTNETYTFEKIILKNSGFLELTDPGSTIILTESDSLTGDGTASLATFGTINANSFGTVAGAGIFIEPSGILNTTNTVAVSNATITNRGTWNNIQNIDLQAEGDLILYSNATGATNGEFNFGGDLTVSSTSNVILVGDVTNNRGVDINFNNITVAAGGLITASGQGYGAGSGPGAGGSHGGYGNSGTPYGDLKMPTLLGSGGFTGGYSPGGPGGGAIKLDVDNTLTLEGSITANGNNGAANVCNQVGGGGSGGSIYINAANLVKNTSSTTNITANGGSGGSNCITAGSGSGGRIAIYVTENDSLTNHANTSIQSRGGVSGNGGAGTYYYEGPTQTPGAGIVKVDNNNISANRATIAGVNQTYTFEKIILTKTGNLELTNSGSTINLTGSDALSGDSTSSLATYGTINADAFGTVSGAGLFIESTGVLNTSDTVNVTNATITHRGSWNNVENINLQSGGNLILYSNATGAVNGEFDFGGDLTVSATSTLTLIGNTTTNKGVSLSFNNITVAAGGLITADGQGYTQNAGPGNGPSYGGYGHMGTPYGNLKEPVDLGTGGRIGSNGPGGTGGGAIKLNVYNTLTLDGSITANGTNGGSAGCNRTGSGASGGSIFITATNLAKNTTSSTVISANGGTGASNCTTGGDGSGGRIAIYATDSDTLTTHPNASISLIGGNRQNNGGPGTYYYEGPTQTPGEGIIKIDNANRGGSQRASITGANQTFIFEKIILTRNGHLELTDSTSTINLTGSDALSGDGSAQLAANGTINALALGDIIGAGLFIEATGILNTSDTVNIENALVSMRGTWNNAQNINLSANGDLTLYSVATGATNGEFDFGGDLTVSSTSIVTLVGDTVNNRGVDLNFNNITVAAGGLITADGQGYTQNAGPGNGPSYGGYGHMGTPYGNLKEPVDLGTGGRIGSNGPGGTGGGAIRLDIANTLILEGSITANGTNGGSAGCNRTGSGASGGSIYITAANLQKGTTSATSIAANGGTGASNCTTGGDGSGGRIAIYATDSDTLTTHPNASISLIGGNRQNNGGPGTYYYEGPTQTPGEGIVKIDNANRGGSQRASITGANQTFTFEKIILTRNGHLEVTQPSSTINLTGSDALSGDSTASLATYGIVNADAFGTVSGAGLFVESTGVLNTSNTVNVTNATITHRGTWNNIQNINLQAAGHLVLYSNATGAVNGEFNFGGDLNVGPTSTVTLMGDTVNNRGVDLNFNNITVEAGGLITASGRGYTENTGPGNGPSYGGYGNSGTPYGDFRYPTMLGSGGLNGGGGTGGTGGGAIRLDVANTLTLEGSIRADGNGGANNGCNRPGGGGTGGSIYITAANLEKTTTNASYITTNGGSGTWVWGCSKSGDGSGGRIAIYVTNSDSLTTHPNLSIQSVGGTFIPNGGPGTYYYEGVGFEPGIGNLKIDNNGVAGRATNFNAVDYNLRDLIIGNNITTYLNQDLLALRSNETLSTDANVENIGDAIAIWNFEENSDDSCANGGDYCDGSGNNRHLNSSGSQRSNEGRVGKALELNGSNYAEVNTSGLTVNSFTVGMWAKLNNFTATASDAEELINFNDIATTSSLDLDDEGNLRFEWPSKLVSGLVSQGKTATMSAAHGSYPGSYCFDGNTNNFCHGASSTSGDWVQVDIGSVRSIDRVDIWNRSDCCAERLKDFKIEISTTGSFTGEQTQVVNLTNQTVGRPSKYNFSAVNGRYIRLTKLNVESLNIAEIQVYESTNYLPQGQWQHVVATYDSTTGLRKIYVDGVKITELNQGTNYSLGINKISIGKGGLGSSTGFVGLIDEVFLYPRALSEAEITLYNNTQSWNEFNDKRGRGPVFNLTGDFYLGTGSILNGKALGFPSESGIGSGRRGVGQSGGAGGGHGGSGGQSEGDGTNSSVQGGTFYGSQRVPLTLGSGGGNAGTGAKGGAGGGALAVRARTGNVDIKGTIDVSGENGKTASPGGGGGAGGSILIEGQSCDISGTLNASGGNGGDDIFDGGGGGGGRISILYTQGPCNASGVVNVANGTSTGGQGGQVGTFPAITSIPATPSFKDQYKTDGETNIPVGGLTSENIVKLKASVSDPGANVGNPQSLVAEFEVVGLNETFTAANLLRGEIKPDYSNTVFAGIYNAPELEYSGGIPLVSEVSVEGLIPGNEYKWRARVLNQDTNVLGAWTEFGNNASNQADFVVSNTVGLEIIPNKTTVIVGEPITVQVNAKNSSNENDPTYTGTVTFSNTPNGNSSLPSNYVFGESDNGTHTFVDQVVFTQAGTYTITVSDTASTSLTATTATITVNLPPAAMQDITITPSKTTVVQGESLDLVIRAFDQYSEIYPNYTGTVTFGSTAGGTVNLPGNYTFNGGDSGQHTFNNVVFNQVGTYTITVTDTSNGSITDTTETITVNPSIQGLSIVPNLTEVNAGDPITLTVSGLNGSSQPDTYYRGTVSFTSTAAEEAILPINYTFTLNDNGLREFVGGLVFTQEGTYTVTVTDVNNNSLTATTGPIKVNPPLPQSDATILELESEATSVLVGESISVKVTAKDEEGNVVNDYYSTVNFSSNASPDVTLPNNYQYTIEDSGVHEFQDELVFAKAGEFTLTVKDILVDSLTDTITINVENSTQSLKITPSNASIKIGDTIDLTVDALNAQNNNDSFYKGTVGFSSTSSSAVLPVEYTFNTEDSGKKVFSNGAKFVESGIYTVTVQDKQNTSLRAVSTNILVNPNNICDENPNQLVCLADIEITNIITEQLSPTSQRVCWKTNIATVGTIQYGIASTEIYSNSTEQETEYVENHCITINELQSDTQYIFKINATSNAGKNASEEGTFVTGNGEIVPVSDARQCINNANSYAFNSNGQAVIRFNTAEETICKIHYGNDSKNLSYVFSEDKKLMNHTATLDLSNLDGKRDMYYQIICASVERTCVENVVVPLAKYLPYYPNKNVELISENVVPVILTITTIATGIINITTYPGMVIYAIPWIGKRRRKSTWGVVFDEVSKEPIPFVQVRIYDEVGKIQKQIVTGFDGKYGFLVNKGTYTLEVKHADYHFEKFEISINENEGIAAKNIGLNRNTVKKNTFKDLLIRFREKAKRNLPRINNSIVIVGFIVSAVALVTTPNIFNYFVASVYLIQLLVLILLNARKREWGYVFDSTNFNRIKSASVRVFDINQGRQIDVQLTDEEGRFGFKLEPGSYHLQVNAAGYELDTDRLSKKYERFNSATGQTLVKVEVKNKQQITIEFPMRKTEEVLGKFEM